MKIRNCEFAQSVINRIAKSNRSVIRLADSTPPSAAFIESKNVIEVTFPVLRREIHNQRRLAGYPERGGSEKRAFNAMRPVLAKYTARRHMSVAFLFPICRKRIKKVLNPDWRRESRERFIFLRS